MFCLLPDLTVSAQVQDSTVLQKTAVDLRIPSEDKIKKYKDDKHFNYEDSRQREYPEWLLKIFDWFGDKMGWTLNKVFSREFSLFIFSTLFVILIIAIIMRVQDVSLRNIFGRRKLETDELDIYAEDVNKMDFETLISDSIKARNYRMAVRFLYLKTLKAMSDNHLIDWSPNKTNYSYLNEIKSVTVRNKFIESTRIFDFVWYGEFVLDDKSFDEAHNFFKELNRSIINER